MARDARLGRVSLKRAAPPHFPQATIERLQQRADALTQAQHMQQQQQHSMPASSSASQGAGGSLGDLEGWAAEKRVLKAICKLALAVTMDQMGGEQWWHWAVFMV